MLTEQEEIEKELIGTIRRGPPPEVITSIKNGVPVWTNLEEPKDPIVCDTHSIDTSRSSQINDLYSSLALAQSEMNIASERKYKAARGSYPRMADIVTASRAALTKHGLSVHQKIYTDEQGRDYLRTELAHSSGQWTSATIRYDFPKGDLDAWQSFIDKMKREAYKAITGCVSDEDDDGMGAQDELYRKKDKGTEPNITYTPKHESSDFITTEQANDLTDECSRYPDVIEQVYKRWKIHHLADLRKSQLKETKDYIRTTIQRRDGLLKD